MKKSINFNLLKSFKTTLISLIILLPISLYLTNINALYLIISLFLIEIFVSFDSSIINTKYLNKINKNYKEYMLSNKILLVSIFLRIMLPVLIIVFTLDVNYLSMFGNSELSNMEIYEMTISESIPIVSAFAGSFLLMTFLNFLFKREREIEWIKILENNKYIEKIKQINFIEIFILSLIGVFIVLVTQDYKVICAYMFGIIVNLSLTYLDNILNINKNKKILIKNGVVGLIYFLILEYSLNMDNILLSFAITNNILIIIIALTLSTIFMRDFINFTIDKKILKKFTYVEHGVNYVIGFLSLIFIVKIFIFVPDYITSFISVFIILRSFYSSYYLNKKNLILLKK